MRSRPRPASPPVGLLAVFLVLVLAAPAAARELPLGPRALEETRTVRTLAPGVTLTRIERGAPSAGDAYLVDVAFTPTRLEARAVARRLRAAGERPVVERIAERAPDDPEPGPLGFLVRVGPFASEDDAAARRQVLAAAGFGDTRVVFSGEDGRRTTGPWVVHVLEVVPEAFPGAIEPVLGTQVVPGRELLTAIAARTGALAAVTGGFFVIGAANGTDGDLAGIAVQDGELVSEAVDGRTSLVLPEPDGRGAFVSALATAHSVLAEDGAAREIDGLNRAPGLIRGCGGDGGDAPTEAPKHDFTCTDASELVLFTPVFGAATAPGGEAEVVLDAWGFVRELREGGAGPIPAGGSVLTGTGEGADWLRAHARVGERLAVDLRLHGERGRLALGGALGVVNGGPRLVRDGEAAITAFAEGFHWPEEPEFFYRFGIRRNPRTLAGVTADGRLLLVVVDGRRPGYSVGASFRESAAIMRAIGARDAVNLDGGGSAALAAGGVLANRPSDPTGERPLGDAIVLTP